MTESAKWREKAKLWAEMAQTTGDDVFFRELTGIAKEATRIADEADAEARVGDIHPSNGSSEPRHGL